MKVQFPIILFVLLVLFPVAGAQSLADAPEPVEHGPSSAQPPEKYAPPSEKEAFRKLLMDSFGPYPVGMALINAGIQQGTDTPPDWPQGMEGFGDRFGSNLGITVVGNAARYSLAEVQNVDTSYHRCTCKKPMERFKHAFFSPLVALRPDGSPTFSYPGLISPYVATTVAVYGWYPERFGAKDAFRMGNYELLGNVGSNLTFEFLPERIRKIMNKAHVNNRRISN